MQTKSHPTDAATERSPYWRLSSFYWFYFASLGALVPFWGPYLKEQGYSAQEIGELVSLLMATKIIAPAIWGWIADHHGHRMLLVRVGSFLATLSFLGVFWASSYWWLFFVMLVFSSFWNAVLPQFEATTFNHLGKQTHRYSWIRVWGSIGFIVAVLILGMVFDHVSLSILPIIVALIMAGIWLSSMLVPEKAAGHLTLSDAPLGAILKRPKVVALFVVCLLVQMAFGPYYAFYSIFLESHDYSKSIIGGLWALGVFAEVLIFLAMPWLVKWFGLRKLLLASLFLGFVRWLLIGHFVDSLVILVFAQLFHAATFGVYHAVAIHYIHLYFTGKHQGRGQALYSSLSFGLGGALGSLYSGYIWDSLGGTLTYSIAGGISLLGFVIGWLYLERIKTLSPTQSQA